VERMRAAVESGNAAITELTEAHPDLGSMGTTLTALLFGGEWVASLNIGDSRTYLLRGGELAQVTKDDSFVQFLVDAGHITPEQAKTHPRRSIVLRSLTGESTIEPTLHVRLARSGDRFLLCSDGLSDVVDFDTIERTMRTGDVATCAETLIELALAGGGPDNVTVIVADVVDDGTVVRPPASSAPTELISPVVVAPRRSKSRFPLLALGLLVMCVGLVLLALAIWQ
jgi:serine/threonine protein phosphatase PrpC